jgi:hypothetical protein
MPEWTMFDVNDPVPPPDLLDNADFLWIAIISRLPWNSLMKLMMVSKWFYVQIIRFLRYGITQKKFTCVENVLESDAEEFAEGYNTYEWSISGDELSPSDIFDRYDTRAITLSLEKMRHYLPNKAAFEDWYKYKSWKVLLVLLWLARDKERALQYTEIHEDTDIDHNHGYDSLTWTCTIYVKGVSTTRCFKLRRFSDATW